MPVASITVSAPAPPAPDPMSVIRSPVDHDVRPDRRRTGPVHHGPPTDDHGHASPPCSPGPGRRTRTRWRAKACMPSVPSSTPNPDCFHPPMGAYMSMADMPCALTNTVPADNRRRHVGRERVVVAPDRRAQAERGVVGRVDRLGRCRRRGSRAARGRIAPGARCPHPPAAPPRAPARRSSPRIPRPPSARGPGGRARRPRRRPRRATPRPDRVRPQCAPGPWSRRRPGRRRPPPSPGGPPAHPPSRPSDPGARRAA